MGRASDLPDDHWLQVAHKKSMFHRQEIENSDLCGCFHCLRMFAAKDINEWVDEGKSVAEQTALCPRCGIDSVIGNKSGFEITDRFLREMRKCWFRF